MDREHWLLIQAQVSVPPPVPGNNNMSHRLLHKDNVREIHTFLYFKYYIIEWEEVYTNILLNVLYNMVASFSILLFYNQKINIQRQL